MGTSYPTSRQTVVCRCALPGAVSAQFMVSGVVFSVCWFSNHRDPKTFFQEKLKKTRRVLTPPKREGG